MCVSNADLLLDPKTGLSSEWHFEILYGFIFPIADRGVPLTLVLFGIDETEWAADAPDPDQRVNDLGSAIGRVTRDTDLVARYGGELFICLLPYCNLQGGLIFADRVRDAISDFTSRSGATVSAAVASNRGEEGTGQEMLDALKGALVAAWAAGGDRVEIPAHRWNV